ncbi:hypothetical protein VP1G_00371 [Cytospora mali]|uniref:Uncharacterized protein n=1 Tax=Cytospora mali TaxID=578113 RepID=A0A194UN90_CYTMA|nr:hypothetical protein VP1G_00371 [Valsa mali var. pyri (nom. inval.)]
MAGLVNASWELPPTSQLNISDCNAIAPWVAYYIVLASQSNSSMPFLTWEGNTPVNVVLDFLRSLVPNNWTQPTDGDLLLWYIDFHNYLLTDIEVLGKMAILSVNDCGSKICPNLDFSGDSDLSGIGMMISYYMVAIFVTIYYFALIPGLFENYRHEFRNMETVKLYRRLASGFEESVSGFLDAMLLFCISMLVAATTRYASLIMYPHKSHSMFGLENCVFLSAFSIFPAIILQSLSFDLRRRRIRLAMWDLVIIFAVTVEVLYRLKYRRWVDDYQFMLSQSSDMTQFSQETWFLVCQKESLRQSLQTLLSVGHAIMLLNSASWLYHVAEIYTGKWWVPALQSRTRLWRRWEGCKLLLRLFNGYICLAIMWAFLGLFTAYRHDVMKKAGEADQDGDWTFGQVLSLTTWIPIGIELLSVYIYGAHKGVEKSLSTRYRVVDRNDTEVPEEEVVNEKRPERRPEKPAGNMEVTPVEDEHS